jgi:hypothetical protein
MNRVLVIVEGPTEQTFVRNVLAPYLAATGVMVSPRILGRPGKKGGISGFIQARNEIVAILKEDTNRFCTTMFDYYGMPDSWPGRAESRNALFSQKASLVESRLTESVGQAMGSAFRHERFIPYVQMHEFEALLFSQPSVLASVMRRPEITQELQKIISEFDSPEMINDDVNSAPSKRLLRLYPPYNKPLHGNIAAERIGLAAIREKCPHFNEWVSKLERLSSNES